MHTRTALVIGAGGFIGHNLVKRLKAEGWYVEGVDLKDPPYEDTDADDFWIADMSNREEVGLQIDRKFDRIYQLAADMGGAGFVFTGSNDANILTNSLGVNVEVLRRVREVGCGTIFYSSSVCVYPAEVLGLEEDAWPAHPPSNYGVEKLASEQMYLAHAANLGMNVRIARFHNCFGPYGTYDGGREKSPAAICRKVAEALDGGEIEIWGDGKQRRPFIYIDDLLDGIEALMLSDITGPVNLGPADDAAITIDQLVDIVSDIAGKSLTKKYVSGPTGEHDRHANNDLARKNLCWQPRRDLKESLRATYQWIEGELKAVK